MNDAANNTVDWRDYQLEKSTRQLENIEWSTCYHYETFEPDVPRLLLIGDSICNGYQNAVRRELAGEAGVSFWASSKCVTDPDYLRALEIILDAYHYDFISFNNGLHSFTSDLTEYQTAFGNVVRYIRAKCPDAKLVITTSTPCADTEKTEKVRVLNKIVWAAAEENGLDVLDLFSHMDPLDRETYWCDPYHYKPEGIQLQCKIIADFFRPLFGK